MAVTDTLINALFDGRYRIVRKLGAGGMANVYLAEDEELGRRVAIKILDDRHSSDEQFVERFRREAQSAAGLSHPNIVSIYDRGEAQGTYYIAMEYLEGRTLKDLLVSKGPPSIRVAINYTRQILAAVRFAHRNGIVHRDIKPHNVLVDNEGRLKVTDFGIARAGGSQMTEAGSIIGTAQYLSPEQARGLRVDRRSDLYSVGVLLYELLTGTVPFTGTTPVEIAMKHLSEVPDPPSRKRAEIPRDLDMIVLRALAKDPDDRYQSAEEMDADLARVERGLRVSDETAEAATAVLAGAGIDETAIATAPIRRTGHYAPYYEYEAPVRRRPLWPWLLALLLLIGAGIGGWYAYNQIQEQLAEAKPVPVPRVIGMAEPLAVQKIRAAGLKPRVFHRRTDAAPQGRVFDQRPDPGERIDKGNRVTILVSAGKPKVVVPSLVGQSVDEAKDELGRLNLHARITEVYSSEEPGTVVGQSPPGGISVLEGATVRINVSKGVRPVEVPSVIGESFEQAAGELSNAGFTVSRTDVNSNRPAGTVVAQNPGGGTLAAKGTLVTLSVSKGPKTTAVPNVAGDDRASATATLENAGFQVLVRQQDTSDVNKDDVVLSQDPLGGTQAVRGATVVLTVGRFTGITTPPTTTTTTATTTTTTPTVP